MYLVSVMDQAIQHSICQGGIADLFMPVLIGRPGPGFMGLSSSGFKALSLENHTFLVHDRVYSLVIDLHTALILQARCHPAVWVTPVLY